MRRTLLRSSVVFAWALAVLAICSAASAQDTPVAFIHGVASGPDTWQEAADRLQSRLQVAPHRAEVSWWESLETQGSQMDAQLGGLPGSTVAVGHSLGGLVARQWSRSHQLDGVITLGTPNRGAPIANHINEWAGFNYALFNAVGNVFYWLGNLSYENWWWVYRGGRRVAELGRLYRELLHLPLAGRAGHAVPAYRSCRRCTSVRPISIISITAQGGKRPRSLLGWGSSTRPASTGAAVRSG